MDQNVTRHVPTELAQSDWSAMIMHYLGLDHIGHKAGPRRYFLILLCVVFLIALFDATL